MFIGSGTVINVASVIIGTFVGVTIAHRLPPRVREVVMDGLGLVTAMIAVLTTAAITDPSLAESLGKGRPVLIVLGSILLGGITGAAIRLEDRLESLGDKLRARFAKEGESTFTEGFVAASLLFCIGPMTILGSITDGLGGGNEMLILKSTLDFFASLAFAAALGWGVAASGISILIVQGGLTLFGYFLGNFMSDVQILMLTATGGLLLVGISMRLLNIKQVPVGNLLPALIYAPLLVAVLS
jgi:uncharacterized membrane protein YqgA involved in biofilm formation